MRNNMIKVYLASPFDAELRKDMNDAIDTLRNKCFMEVYAPVEHSIPNAWDYPNDEWALMVFESDINAINDADVLVLLSYGRKQTAGSAWEAGYAFAMGKKVIVVEMNDEIASLMVSNGRYATVKGLKGLEEYDWSEMPKTRTNTEQK